ncbi:MAG TPA: hypothetical protein VGX78_21645, partial [Pirellulales bacterium]|nr:hypothetical protein [Pirellulales bacterium]
MTGHGGPSASWKPCRHRAWHSARGIVGLMWAAAMALCANRAAGDEPTLRLRIEWRGPTEQQWQGSIELTEGALASPRALG